MGNNIEYIPMGTTKDLGSLIRKRRKEAKITLNALASLMGVSPRFLAELEQGRETIAPGKLPPGSCFRFWLLMVSTCLSVPDEYAT